MGFLEYSDISFRAYGVSSKQQEIVQRKHSILKSCYDYYAMEPRSILFVGFNPAILQCTADKIYVAEISPEIESWLHSNGVPFELVQIEDLFNYGKTFDAVIAVEEYFTFFNEETAQKTQFEMICKTVKKIMITTLRDYKNQEFKDREFSIPAVIKNDTGALIFLEYHEYDSTDRNAWSRIVYEIENNQLRVNSRFYCRQMFFKQCAKFGYDSGALEFLVHKNLMYKSLIKKNYEHVISIKFG